MAEQVARIDTLFIHERDDDYAVVVNRRGERILYGALELVERSAGPRPGRFVITENGRTIPRQPDEFVTLARRADGIRISEQTSDAARSALRSMLEAYQLSATTVRTCRYCASAGRYTPITEDHGITTGSDIVCQACAKRELERELGYHGGLTAAARDRLIDLMVTVGDLDRITALLEGSMDPELTKVDVISATADAVEPVSVDELTVAPELAAILGSRFDELLPVQSVSIRNGLLDGTDQLVVSATATGKTLIGEIAGLDRILAGEGTLVFLVPLVALANQTYRDLQRDYGDLVDVTLRVGASRIRDDGQAFDPSADVIVGTYEGIDHALRTGRDLGKVGTVVIDEVHTLSTEERGHRLDGLIARLHDYCEHASGTTQWIYLSATVGNPEWLAGRLDATLIQFEDRPVPIERHVAFADGLEKPEVVNRLVKREFDRTSTKGYRGQTIVFTNARRRCHELARRLEYDAAAYHAGLDRQERQRIEERFGEGELAAVVTTAALGAGVDFPASQVIFDSLAMGIEWLTIQEFEQMLGRAGRPDYHDRGTVYLLVEPDGRYHAGMDRTEDEVAFALLTGETEDVYTSYDESAAVEEMLANVVVGRARAKALSDRMIGELPAQYALGKLIEYGFIDGLEPTPLGQAVTEHFLSPAVAFCMLEGIRHEADPFDIVCDVELLGQHQ